MMTDRVKVPAHIVKLCKTAEVFFEPDPKEYRDFMNSVARCTLGKLEKLGHIKQVLKVWEDKDGWCVGNKTLYAWVELACGEAGKLEWNDSNRGFLLKSSAGGAGVPPFGHVYVTQAEYDEFGV